MKTKNTIRYSNPHPTERQVSQSSDEKRRVCELRARSGHSVTRNPPVIIKPFSIIGLPGTVRLVTEIRRKDGSPSYLKTQRGQIFRNHTPLAFKKFAV